MTVSGRDIHTSIKVMSGGLNKVILENSLLAKKLIGASTAIDSTTSIEDICSIRNTIPDLLSGSQCGRSIVGLSTQVSRRNRIRLGCNIASKKWNPVRSSTSRSKLYT